MPYINGEQTIYVCCIQRNDAPGLIRCNAVTARVVIPDDLTGGGSGTPAVHGFSQTEDAEKERLAREGNYG